MYRFPHKPPTDIAEYNWTRCYQQAPIYQPLTVNLLAKGTLLSHSACTAPMIRKLPPPKLPSLVFF